LGNVETKERTEKENEKINDKEENSFFLVEFDKL